MAAPDDLAPPASDDMASVVDMGTGSASRYSLDGPVLAALHVGKSWYLGGSFSRISPYAASNLLAIDSTGTPTGCALDTSFDGPISAIAVSGNSIYVGGSFFHYQGASANAIAKIDATSCALDTTFSPPASNGFGGGLAGSVQALAVSGSALYAGGTFTTYRGASANHIAKLDLTSGVLDTTFSPSSSNGFDSNGAVQAMLVSGTSLYVGGTFNSYRGVVGSSSSLAKVDLTSGELDTTFSPPSDNGFFGGTVNALAASSTSLYVGGVFHAYRNVTSSANYLAKLDLASGAIDATFSPVGATSNGFDDAVFAVALSGNALYVGGQFHNYRGTNAVNCLAKLDATSGGIDNTTFNPAGSGITGNGGASGQVGALAVNGAALFVGGLITAYGGHAVDAFAQVDATTGALNTAFHPPAHNTIGFVGDPSSNMKPTTGLVNALTWQGTSLWVGGRFKLYSGWSAHNVAKLDDASYAVDTTFSPPTQDGFDNNVNALASDGASLYVGGMFTQYRGVANSAEALAKLDLASGAIDTTFSPVGATSNGFNGPVQALAVAAASLYVGGSFAAYRGVASSANHIAKLDLASGAIDTTFGPPGATSNGFDSVVESLAVAGTSLCVGGAFTAYRGIASSANRVAKLDLTSGAIDTTFSPVGAAANGFDSDVKVLAVSGGSLFAGGTFTSYRSVSPNAGSIAKLDVTSGALDATFNAVGSFYGGFDGDVLSLAVSGSAVYAGGAFTMYRTTGSAKRLAKLDVATGALDTTFNPPANNGVEMSSIDALAVANGVLVAGGSFTTYRGSFVRALVVADPTSGALLY